MSGAIEGIRAIRQSASQSPKTVLGFCAIVVGLEETGVLGLVAVLATTGAAAWLIPWLVLVGLSVPLLVILAVLIISWRDPSKLMLGQVSGTEYVHIQQMSVGAGGVPSQLPMDDIRRELTFQERRPQS